MIRCARRRLSRNEVVPDDKKEKPNMAGRGLAGPHWGKVDVDI